MGLADQLATLRPTTRTKPLAVDRVLAGLGDTDRDALLAALHNPDLTAPDIARVLEENGLSPVGDMGQAIRTWRMRNRGTRG